MTEEALTVEGGKDVFVPFSLVPRRLFARLDPLVDGKIAVIVAPAGYHKTALVHHWVQSRPEVDSRAVRLVLPSNRPPKSLDNLIAALNRMPAGSPKFAWVDNLDRMPPQQLHSLLDIVESDSDVRLILAGRTRPNIPLSSWALRGQLIDIGPDELALTRDELRSLVADQDTPDSALDIVMDMYRGWPMAVDLLLTRPLSWAQVPAIEATIDGYIEEEVLGDLSQEDLHFLEDLSALPELNPAAATHLSGRPDAGAQLARLAAVGVPLEWDAGNVIRFNPAVRRYLQRSMQQDDPGRVLAQNRKAASWLRAKGEPEEALRHAVASNDVELTYDLATELVVSRLGQDPKGLTTWLESSIGMLPPSFLVGLARTLLLALTRPGSVGLQSLRILQTQMPSDASDNDRARFYAVVLCVARVSGYAKDSELVDEALAWAKDVAAGTRQAALLEAAALLVEYGLHALVMGRLDESQEVLQQVSSNARIVGVSWLSNLAQGGLAFIEALQGNALTSRRLAEEVVASADANEEASWVKELALLALADVALDRGEAAAMGAVIDTLALQHSPMRVEGMEPFRVALDAYHAVIIKKPIEGVRRVQTFRRGFDASASRYQQHLVSAAMMTALTSAGDMGEAEREQELLQGEPEPGQVDVRPTIAAHRARLELARGNPQKALELTSPLIEDASITSRNKMFLHMLMMHGVASSQIGDSGESLAAFQRAGILAERLGLAVPGALHTLSATTIRSDQIDLTPAEKQVLAHLEGDAPLAEVASALFISQNTLKTHLRRIYKKLGASGRPDAIQRAKAMGLL